MHIHNKYICGQSVESSFEMVQMKIMVMLKFIKDEFIVAKFFY